MRRLYLAAVNNRYGRNVFFPYAAGLMWAYARQQSWVQEGFVLGGEMLYRKEPIDEALARLDRPDVLALSSYIWNWEWNKAFAKAVKQKWPECKIIVGGIQVPNASPRVLLENPQFDFAVYGEGERAFTMFLIRLHHHGLPVTDPAFSYGDIDSLIWRDTNGTPHVNPRAKPLDPNEIPSPYLEGLFDELAADKTWKWQALQETNRGCPYSCTFCAWGDAALSKLAQFSTERVIHELTWFARNGVELIYNCDANFGILKRDLELVDAMISLKEKYHVKQQFRAAFAKNSNDLVFDISKRLHDAGMLKATTLALQSMDDGVLTQIKRKNIKYTKLAELAARYEAAGIATYSELIVGLPGETLESFVAGIDALLDAGQHSGLSIYLCMLLENTEMASAESRERHGIVSAKMRALLYHGTPEPGAVEEIQETVIATATMPHDMVDLAVLYGWTVQALHSFGLTQHVARTLRAHGVKYSHFYMRLLDWLCNSLSEPGAVFAQMVALWRAAVAGESWQTVDPRFGDVSWPPEELLFLLLAVDTDAFYEELGFFLEHAFPDAPGGAQALAAAQRALFIPPEPGQEETYAREAVWYGRKGPGAKLRVKEPKDV